MNKFNKLFHYYLSSYWNNSRTLSSMYSFLKIFFERNNKIDSTVAVFGNVFRNSKWNNMQIQNIKKSHLRQWLFFFILIISVFFYIFVYGNTTLDYIYLNFFFLKQSFNEILTNFYYLVGCIVFQMIGYWNSLFILNQKNSLNPKTSLPTPSTTLFVDKNKIAVNNLFTSQTSNINSNIFFLQKTLLYLNNIHYSNNEINQPTHVLTLTPNFTNKIWYSNISSSNINKFTEYNYENRYTLSTDLNSKFNNVLAYSTTLSNTLNQVNSSNDPLLNETSINNFNNIAKNQRWLTRNFWSNQNIINDTNKFVEIKNFIQNPLTSSSAIDKNIWLSNKLFNSEIEKTTSLFNNLSTNPELLAQFNFFDNSRFYTNQRYNYLNNLSNQNIQMSTNLNVNTSNIVSNINTKYSTLQSYFLRNYVLNLSLYTTNNLPITNSSTLNNSFLNKPMNIFQTINVTDLLQHNDLHALNTFNTVSNTSQTIFLNKNSSNFNYKS